MASKKVDVHRFDQRTIERKLSAGKIDPKEYAAYVNALPDDAALATYIEVYEEPPPEELTPHVDELTFTSA